ncbi:MAG: lipoate--protein ligase [Erysipelotrichaceae bacterium]|nr:lipoate--protein ligase [Erysipelotrichaceae bacterium]
MLKHAYLITSDNINPYYNLALEESLFLQHQPTTIMFYLWQNHHTVVIGKNQNAYKECNLQQMESDHCYLARRSTGGGAVYHDLGNLNFTFIVDAEDYDVKRQSNVIINALATFNITANLSGRNDIEVNNKKISGNAFLATENKKMQHGTLLVNIDKASLGKYLKVSATKIKAKGVASVEGRVENIAFFNPAVTIASLKKALITAFEKEYQLELNPYFSKLPLNDLLEKYHSYNYLYNRLPDYALVINERLSFGEVEVYASIVNNYIMDITIFTDALPLSFIDRLKTNLVMTYLDPIAFKQRLTQFVFEDQPYLDDVLYLLNKIKEENDGI